MSRKVEFNLSDKRKQIIPSHLSSVLRGIFDFDFRLGFNEDTVKSIFYEHYVNGVNIDDLAERFSYSDRHITRLLSGFMFLLLLRCLCIIADLKRNFRR